MSPPPSRIVFAGSPEFAVPALERLVASSHQVVAVLTQPDRPAGRGRKLQAGPVKACALAHGLPLLQPASLRRDAGAREALRGLAPDLIVVVAYGLLLPPEVLAIPPRGCLNIHASLLPRWRGAAPIQAAVLAGDAQTGVALMRLEEGLDTGPVAAMQALDIGPADTAGELHDRLARLGADLLMAELDGILDGRARFVPQPATGVTHAPKITKAEAIIDWREPAVALDRRIRAFNPWPVAETRLEGQQLRCWLARPQAGGDRTAPPGRVLAAGADGIDVQTGDGVLRLLSVQLAGRQRVAAGVFANGFAVVGRVLGA
ncbi:methionyl-tRNA formyltransferase [Gammaproteobacteria bacterium]|nr:methionyl-tRNA formyltransferase [Gammaproteobacteria bacterium]CAG0944648.1 methionyl-tRNA formyltransferase [Gammaproteobacteria bacterium]